MFDEEPDRDPHGECRAEIARLTAELAAARAVPADVEEAIDAYEARVTSLVTSMTGRAADDAADVDVARNNLRAAIARAISEAQAAAVSDFIDGHAKRLCEQAGESWEAERTKLGCWPGAVREVLDMLFATPAGLIVDGRSRQAERARAATPSTVGGLLAAAPVGAIVEADGGCAAWEQARVTVDDDGMEIPWRRRWMASKSWTTWRQGHPTAIRDFGRLVPASEADRDPATRGPLPKGG